VDPYDPSRFLALYPVPLPYPLHAPINLAVHLPLGLLSRGAAGLTYFLLVALLTLPLAYLCLRLSGVQPQGKVVFLAAAILLTRPGHWDLVIGQRAIFLSLATCIALFYAGTAPWLSGAGIAISMIKPTWGIPLALLMSIGGYGPAVLAALVISCVANLPILALLVAWEGGIAGFAQTLLRALHAWQVEMSPVTSYSRLDATTTLSRFLGHPLSGPAQVLLAVGLLLAPGVVLRALRGQSDSGARHVVIAIICLGLLLASFPGTGCPRFRTAQE
jgi:Glycosyltransferase family 87